MVLSIDFTCTLILGVIGEITCFMGLKLSMAATILFEIDCRVLIRTPRQFRVAFTKRALL